MTANTDAEASTAMAREHQRIERVAEWFDSRDGFNRRLVESGLEAIFAHAQGPRVLQMGCAMGLMTEQFLRKPWQLWVVEGSEKYATRVRELFVRYGMPAERVLCALFEEIQPSDGFDDIVIAYALEHVLDPIEVLARARSCLIEGGRIHVLVPHANSLHRLVGVETGMLASAHKLNDKDIEIGHRRVYTWEGLEAHIHEAGLTAKLGGIMVKPFPNKQMEALDEKQIEGLRALGRRYPLLSSELYALCTVPDEAGEL